MVCNHASKRDKTLQNSKLLWCLFGFQTLLVLLLVFQTNSLNNQVQKLSAQTTSTIQNLSTPALASASHKEIVNSPEIYQANNSPTIKEIRAVIAEELQIIETNIAVQANKKVAKPTYTNPELSEHTIEQMSDDVHDMIVSLYGQDLVGASEIALVERAIVKLPPSERQEAFRQLNIAVNTGQINTRF